MTSRNWRLYGALALNLLGLDPIYQDIVYGGIILIAAGVDARLRRGVV